MAGKKTSGSSNAARKKKVPIKDLSSPSQELSEGQARAVKGGAGLSGAGAGKAKVADFEIHMTTSQT
jgi:hypothetical protein